MQFDVHNCILAAWLRRQRAGGWPREWLLALLLCFTAICGMAEPAAAQSATEQRERAVTRARAGNVGEAVVALRAMLAAGVDDGRVAMDLTTLLQQDGKSEEAAAVFAKADRGDSPSYALLAAVRANRMLRRYDEAQRLARDGARRFPADPVWPLSLSLVLSDAGKSTEALEALRAPVVARAPPVERLLAEAYAYRRGGDPFRALRLYTEAMRLAPANPEPRREAAGVMIELGGPYGAAMIAGTTPEIAAAQAGAMVRWGGDIRSPDSARRFEGTDAAIARLDALLALPSTDAALRRRLRLDRMVALRDRVRMQDAAGEGDALRADAVLPSYAEEAYADALLYLRRREEARDAYDRVLAQDPRNIRARYGQFYAAVELEDFTTAYAAIDVLLKGDEPVFRTYVGDATRYDNADRTTAELTAAEARLYGNQLGDAWARISGLSDAAPANGSIRIAKSRIALARGWPRLATEEAEIAFSLVPRDPRAAIALVEVALANYRFAEADRRLAELVALYPENRAVQRLAREVDAQHRWLLDVEVSPSSNSGGGANAPGNELVSTARLYTPPIADNWRLFALADYSFANPIEGFVHRERAGAGVELRTPAVTATLFPTFSFGTLGRAGGGGTVDWSVTDQILLGASAESFSPDTPLRALFYGITADEYALKAAYRWHESRSIALVGAMLPFSDGNRRLTGALAYKEKLIDVPHFDLTGLIDLGTSSNTSTNAPYYNPARDLSATAGFLAEHVLWRRYDASLVQALKVEGGLYSEQGFADDWIGAAGYEHRWRFDPYTEFRYGIELSRRVYDGAEVRGIALVVGLRQRI